MWPPAFLYLPIRKKKYNPLGNNQRYLLLNQITVTFLYHFIYRNHIYKQTNDTTKSAATMTSDAPNPSETEKSCENHENIIYNEISPCSKNTAECDDHTYAEINEQTKFDWYP